MLISPFSVTRHLYPRASGMIVFKGGGGGTTTNTTVQTGLGDEQADMLALNQEGISTQITDARTDATTRYDTFDDRFDTIDTRFTGVTDGFGNITDLMDQYNTARNTQYDAGVSNSNRNNAAIGANATSLGNLSGEVATGFGGVGERFDTVDTNVGNVQTAVDTGFVDQAQGFTDAQADRTTQFAAAQGAQDASFDAANTAINTGFTDAEAARATNSANALTGQSELSGELTTMSDAADTYATQLLADQAAMQAGNDSFSSNFDAYSDRYTEDNTLAQQTRADMQAANANANIKIRQDLGAFSDAAAQGQQGISNQLDGVNQVVEGGFMAADASSAANQAETRSAMSQNQSANTNAATDLQGSLANGLENLDAGQITAARDMAKIASSQTDLDMGMRQNFNQLGSAFDDTGNLIASSIDENGNTIQRQMDQQGNMILNQFDVSGNAIGRKIINVNDTLTQLGQLGNTQGSNVSMGNLTPASSSQVPSGGFASPFAQTG